MHTIRVIPNKLSDGSVAYDVLVQINGSIKAISDRDALEMIEKLSVAIRDHSNDEVNLHWGA